jgi:acetyl-CoA acetyltransferase
VGVSIRVTMPAYFGMIASAHMAKYGTTPEQLGKIRFKSEFMEN